MWKLLKCYSSFCPGQTNKIDKTEKQKYNVRLLVAEQSLEMVFKMPFKAKTSKLDVISTNNLFIFGRLLATKISNGLCLSLLFFVPNWA